MDITDFMEAKNAQQNTGEIKISSIISSRTEEEQFKESRHTKQSQGHIVPYNPSTGYNSTLFLLKKYESHNKGYGYIL